MNWKIIGCSLTILLLHFVVSNAEFDLTNPTSCPSDLEPDIRKKCCGKLKRLARRVAPFTCCTPNYPRWTVTSNEWYSCIFQCDIPLYYEDQDYLPLKCCHLPCVYRDKIKVVSDNPADGVIIESLKTLFKRAVNNAPVWDDVINAAADGCNNVYRKENPTTDDNATLTAFWDCPNVIPNYYYDIRTCMYNDVLINCPTFNETASKFCPLWPALIRDCYPNSQSTYFYQKKD